MRILGLDPGAFRMGWAVIDTAGYATPYTLVASGIHGIKRAKTEEFQAFRWRLIEYWAVYAPRLLDMHLPDLIVSETIPAVGGGNFIAATQSELAKTAITVCQAFAVAQHYEWKQIAATTVKKDLTGNGKATKVGVRNAVIKAFPELGPRKKELTTYADESDAIGIALVGAGFKHTP